MQIWKKWLANGRRTRRQTSATTYRHAHLATVDSTFQLGDNDALLMNGPLLLTLAYTDSGSDVYDAFISRSVRQSLRDSEELLEPID